MPSPGEAHMIDAPLMQAQAVEKRFGKVVALRQVNFDLLRGEVHAIVGDNGAGKSTFIKILSGVLQPDGGQVRLDGQPVELKSPQDAHRLGIETVYQDLALAGHLDAAGNLYLGREAMLPGLLGRLGFLDNKTMRQRAESEMRRLKIGIKSVEQPVHSLSGGQRQAVAVSRAVAWGTRVVIMDEPTAALGVRESLMVLELIRETRKHGLGIIMISHNLPEVFDVADRITVMRLGQSISTFSKGDTSMEEIVGMMTGAEMNYLRTGR